MPSKFSPDIKGLYRESREKITGIEKDRDVEIERIMADIDRRQIDKLRRQMGNK